MNKIYQTNIHFGCDPELFFTKNGAVIGSEKVVPEQGIVYKKKSKNVPLNATVVQTEGGTIIRDGIQVELNPRANSCRANLGNEIAYCFGELYRLLKKKENAGVKLEFSRTVPITQEEMDSLSDKSKTFGCTPSYNIYGEEFHLPRDASKIFTRSAGGHLHLGVTANKEAERTLRNPKRLVPMLDLIVGNTCVLIDREAGNAERRKLYGRAGEYRKPVYGIEYRTLSNFWLRHYQLMSLVTGLARQAVSIVASSTPENDYAKEFMGAVSIKDVRDAINNNDLVLARKNFDAIKPLIEKYFDYGEFPLTSTRMKQFEHFLYKIFINGVGYWFPQDPLTSWRNLPEGHGLGFESFLSKEVKEDMIKK